MKHIVRVLCFAIFLGLVFHPEPTDSCGPFIPSVVFTRTARPDNRSTEFLSGKIGVLLPTWDAQYLVVAYRYLSGLPLSAKERQSIGEMWEEVPGDEHYDKLVQAWNDERAKHTDAASTEVSPYRPTSMYGYYMNCLGPAFQNAAETLRARASEFKSQTQLVRDWIDAQDLVFQNCAGQEKTIPAIASATIPELLRADRAYQIAAANFYAGDYDTAIAAFDHVATDTKSPWHAIAPYLAARAVVRKATTKYETYDPELLKEAEARLRPLLRDAGRESIRSAVNDLLGLIAFRIHPGARLRELDGLLSQGKEDTSFARHLKDYRWLVEGYGIYSSPITLQPGTPAYAQAYEQWRTQRNEEIDAARKANDMSDWIRTIAAETNELNMLSTAGARRSLCHG